MKQLIRQCLDDEIDDQIQVDGRCFTLNYTGRYEVWVEGYQAWVLIATNPENDNQYWRGAENNAAKLLCYIEDEDIRDFYDEVLAEQYDEEVAE